MNDGNDGYHQLTGNQVGVLLFNYLLQTTPNVSGAVVVKTYVTTPMIDRIAERYGVEVIETYVGFKHISEKIEQIEREEGKHFLLGIEESGGYLVGSAIRDKDWIMASLLVCEMASHYLARNMTLIDVLNGLFKEYGFHHECVKYIPINKWDKQTDQLMEQVRSLLIQEVAQLGIEVLVDFNRQESYDFRSRKTEC